jgi:WD40 repeat protein
MKRILPSHPFLLATVASVSLAILALSGPTAEPPAGRASTAASGVTPKPATDRFEDPLPYGATARLGTVRFRHDSSCAAYSPDGKIIASGGNDNHIRLFDAKTGKEIRTLAGHQPRTYTAPKQLNSANDLLVENVGKGTVTAVAFSPDGKVLASGGWDDMVRLWDVETGDEIRHLLGHRGMVASVVYSPDGKYLATRGGIDGAVKLWEPNTGRELQRYTSLSRVNPWRFNREAPLAFSPDSKTLVAGDQKVIHFWDVAGGNETRKLEAHPWGTLTVAFSSDGKMLASGGIDGDDKHSLRIWDLTKNPKDLKDPKDAELRRCELPKDEPPIHCAFSPKGDQLAAVVEEDDTHIFDPATGKHVHRLKHYWASRVAFAPDGQTLVSARGPVLRLWDPATGKEKFQEFEGHHSGVSTVALSSDGKTVASGGEQIRLWDAVTGKPLREIAVKAHVGALAFSPDGKQLATAGHDRVVRLWEVSSGKETAKFEGLKHMLCGVAFSPDGDKLAAGDVQSTIRIWDVKNQQMLQEMDMKSGTEVLSLAFSPDGSTLACAGAWNDSSFLPAGIINIQGVEFTAKKGYQVLTWDAKTGKEGQRFEGLRDNLRSVAFSPDGKLIAAASSDGAIAIWDAANGKEHLYIKAHPEHADSAFHATPSIAFAPDSKTLVSASTDRTIRWWDMTTAKELGRFRADGGILSLAIGKDGKTLVTGSEDTSVTIWDLKQSVNFKTSDKPGVIFLR